MVSRGTDGPSNKQRPAREALLDAIQSLGGNSDDLALLAGVDSGTEDEAFFTALSSKQDKKLDKDLRLLLRELDFRNAEGTDIVHEEPPAKRKKLDPLASSATENGRKVIDAISRPQPTSNGREVDQNQEWLVHPTAHWNGLSLAPLPDASANKLTPERKDAMRARAETLLDDSSRQYAKALSDTVDQDALPIPLTRSDKVFLSNVLSSGTSTDRISALVLIISSSPLHSTAYLKQLLGLCSKKSRDEALRALQSVSEWLRSAEGGLPDRKLKWFDDRDEDLRRLAASQSGFKSKEWQPGDQWLVVWMFEDWLKRWYLDLIRVVESLSRDPLPYVRTRALAQACALLSAKPEQEQNLLILVTSLLADSDRAVASKASHLLLELLEEHPMMKAVVIREVAAIVLRPISDAKSLHGRYYGIITLNQIVLQRTEDMVANKLIDVYFKVFSDVLAEGQRQRASGKGERHLAPTQHDAEVESKLLAAVLTGVNRASPYANLQGDALQDRLDVLYRITHQGSFSVSLQALTMIHRFTTSSLPKSAPPDRFYRTLYESLIDRRLPNASKHAMYLNLVFRCLQADPSSARCAAFAKRLLQSLIYHQTPYVCGVLRLLSELFLLQPNLRVMFTVAESKRAPMPESLGGPASDNSNEAPNPETGKKSAGSYSNKILYSSHSATTAYDPRKRDPQYANAEGACLWELVPLLDHFHPSVRQYAAELLSGMTSTNDKDMDHYCLSDFLNRCAYREVKVADVSKPAPLRKTFVRSKGNISIGPVNSETFANTNVDKVPADQIFFHRFFTAKHASREARGGHQDESQVDLASNDAETGLASEAVHSDSELEEDEILTAMRASAKGTVGLDPSLDQDDASDESSVAYTTEEENGFSASPQHMAPEQDEEASADEVASDTDDSFAHFEEEDDILASDAEIDVADTQVQAGASTKRKRRKLNSLPLFADAEAWSQIIEGGHGPAI